MTMLRGMAVLLLLAGCGLPRDIVGPVDHGAVRPDPTAPCPLPEEGSGAAALCP